MQLIQDKIDQHTTELKNQSLTYPSTLSSLEVIDSRLKDFVHLHHIDLIRTVRYHMNQLKDDIHEKELFKQLSYYYLKADQVSINHSLIVIFSISYVSF